MILLALMSLVTIPAMIAAGGEHAWGSIALGQSIGGLGGVVVGYGWGWFGPTRVAQASATGRRAEYIESIATRGVLVFPVSAVAATVAYALAPSAPLFAAAGSIQTTSIGLTATWYYVGLARPLPFLIFETLPRMVGAGAGVILMRHGSSAIMGPIFMFFGMIIGLAVSTIWILTEARRAGAQTRPIRPLGRILYSNRHGLAATFAMACYNAAPIAIVSQAAPSIQPMFALADKVKLQINIASTPAVAVLQSWIPRATESRRFSRAKIALVASFVFAILLGCGTLFLGPLLVKILANGQISLSPEAITVMAVSVSATLFQSVLQSAVLAAFDRLRTVAKAVAFGAIVGLPLVLLGSVVAGVSGALGGALAGSLVIVTVELSDFISVMRKSRSTDGK